jgi:TorA maturation chaperone TorD
MIQDNSSSVKMDLDSPEYAQSLTVRSGIYALLAHGFLQPDRNTVEFFHRCNEIQLNKDELMSSRLAEVVASAHSAGLDELQQAYIQVFDPVHGPFPYEVEHKKGHEYAKAQIMADVMGFYRAFGVEPRADRADHIAAELEFMHLLTLKEAHALKAGQADKAELCREAQQKFLREHLLTWHLALIKVIRAKLGDDSLIFYPHLLNVFELFIKTEKENLT